MAPRANWKGHLRLSLVSCPVSLYPASSEKERVSFNRINRQTGNRLKQSNVDAVSGETVESWDIVKGYEYSKNMYALIEDEELEEIKLESTKIIDIDSFVAHPEKIDRKWFSQPYWIAPNDKVGQEAFAVIRESMRKSKVAGIGRVVIGRRERPILLLPYENGLLGITLRYANEVREAQGYFDEIPEVKLPKEAVDLASNIIESRITTFDPEKFVDRYEEAVVELVREKQKEAVGLSPKKSEEVKSANRFSINIMDALHASVVSESKAKGKPAPKRTKLESKSTH